MKQQGKYKNSYNYYRKAGSNGSAASQQSNSNSQKSQNRKINGDSEIRQDGVQSYHEYQNENDYGENYRGQYSYSYGNKYAAHQPRNSPVKGAQKGYYSNYYNSNEVSDYYQETQYNHQEIHSRAAAEDNQGTGANGSYKYNKSGHYPKQSNRKKQKQHQSSEDVDVWRRYESNHDYSQDYDYDQRDYQHPSPQKSGSGAYSASKNGKNGGYGRQDQYYSQSSYQQYPTYGPEPQQNISNRGNKAANQPKGSNNFHGSSSYFNNKDYMAQNQKSGNKRSAKQSAQPKTQSISSGSQEGTNGSRGGKSESYSKLANQGNRVRRNYVCYVCRTDLKEVEKEFYPCNCKYQICYACYYHQVQAKERKCPNCGKHYEVGRVEEYKQSRIAPSGQMEARVEPVEEISKPKHQVDKGAAQKQIYVRKHPQTAIRRVSETQEAVPPTEDQQDAVARPDEKVELAGTEQQKTTGQQADNGAPRSLSKVSRSQEDIQITAMITAGEIKNQVVKLNPSSPKRVEEPEEYCEPILDLTPVEKLPDSSSNQKKNDQKQGNTPLIAIDRQAPSILPKIKTDEDIPIKFQESGKLIETDNIVKHLYQHHDEASLQEQQMPTVQQKYDLVSKNQDRDDIEQNLQNCNFQQVNGPEPEDSECMEIVSMRSSQTQNIMNTRQANQQGIIRRTNSQENMLTSQSQFLHQSSSQSGFSVSALNHQTKLSNFNASFKNMVSTKSGQQPTTKGIKHSKIRIIQKTTVYVIGLSPSLADESVMRRYEYFGQYGKIQHITINKDNAFTSSVQENAGGVGGESTSSNKSQISYAAYITYTSPQDASLAIMALDQHQYEGRLIRASYGRTKYCKFFLKNYACPKKDCPYKHKESKEQDILTPDDMQKKALFQYCQQLAMQISKITDMTESQFRNLLKHKRDRLSHQNNSKHVLPKVESIFENKDLMKKIDLMKLTLLSAKRSLGGNEVSLRIDNQRMVQNSDLNSDQINGFVSIHNQHVQAMRTQKQQQNQAAPPLTSGLPKTRRLQQQPSTPSTPVVNMTNNNQNYKVLYKQKTQTLRIDNEEANKLKQPRSGSHRHQEKEELKRKLLEGDVIKGGERSSMTPRRHSYSRMLSQSRKEIKLQDIKNQVSTKPQNGQKVSEFIEKQQNKYLKASLSNLQANANLKPAELNSLFTQRTNRLLSKEDESNQPIENTEAEAIVNRNERDDDKDEAVKRGPSYSGNRRYGFGYGDRKKSVSKSIQRQNSLSSLVDYTLKFLNDDMAITLNTSMRGVQEPLIEKSVEDDTPENQSQINRMIFQDQMIYNYNQMDQDQYDAKSSYFSNGDSRGQAGSVKNQSTIMNKNESIFKIWENFDNIDHILTLKNQNSNSDQKMKAGQFDTQSYQDYRMRSSLLMPSIINSQMSQRFNDSNSINLVNNNHQFSSRPNQNMPMQNIFGFYNQKMQQKSTMANQNNNNNNSTQLHINAKPFIKTQQNTTNKSNSNSYGGGQQHVQGAPLQLHQSPRGAFQQLQTSQQISSFNLPGASGPSYQQSRCKELNEKNLYLFDKQQEELFDKHQHWNKIFLPASGSRGHQCIKATTDSGQDGGLLTSQSVFCFPMGTQEGEQQKLDFSEFEKKNQIGKSEQKLHHFDVFEQKRKSAYVPGNTRAGDGNNNSNNSENQIPQTPGKKAIPVKQMSSSFGAGFQNAKTQSSMQLANRLTSFKTNENKTADECGHDEFDRRSAGDRFGFTTSTSAYQELIKVNHIFSSGPKMRRNSCSQSQSHSRVRMQPSIYHQDDSFQKSNFAALQKKNNDFIMMQSPSTVSESNLDGALKLANQSNQSQRVPPNSGIKLDSESQGIAALLCQTPQKTAEDDLDNQMYSSGTQKQFGSLILKHMQQYNSTKHLTACPDALRQTENRSEDMNY